VMIAFTSRGSMHIAAKTSIWVKLNQKSIPNLVIGCLS
jgi:hypothetical protein